MAVNIHITIIELNALHTKRQNLFQELDAVIHLLMEAKHWGLRKSRNATSLNSRFKSLDTLKVKIISVTFRRVIRTNHKKASKIWRHENIQLGDFPAPVEFIAAVIAYYVHPVNIQTACLIMEGAEFTENIINGVERPVKAAELFAFTLRVRAGNTD